jgi:hypothetical protein
MTGPSYPVKGSLSIGGEPVSYRLPRSHGGAGGLVVTLSVPSIVESGWLHWRRFPTQEAWQDLELVRTREGVLQAVIPHQPPAGKVEYWIELVGSGIRSAIAADETVVARFRGEVPATVLVPHILAMFGSMLLASRTLFEVLRPGAPRARGLILATMLLLVVGGLMLGPLVQKYAFDAFWTGWPLGTDLTDNKTLLAVLAWSPAVFAALSDRKTRLAAVLGWLVMMGVFLIPHSVRGSELDWSAHTEQVNRGAPSSRKTVRVSYQSTSTLRGLPPNRATITQRLRLPKS